jgi:hypothetical protein
VISDSGGNTKVDVTFTYGGPSGVCTATWSKTFSGAQDCTAWSTESIPYVSHSCTAGSGCTHDGSAVTITANP